MSDVEISREAVAGISVGFYTLYHSNSGTQAVVDPDRAMKALDMLRALRDRVDELEEWQRLAGWIEEDEEVDEWGFPVAKEMK